MPPQPSEVDVVPPASVQRLLDMFPGALLRPNQKAAAEEALTAILDDVERAGGTRPWIEVIADDRVRLAYIRDHASAEGPSEGLGASDLTEPLVEVAVAVVLDRLGDEDKSFPCESSEHRVQLHPQLGDRRAVWWCHPLDMSSPRSAASG